jgi:uncharacterized protein (DUF2062 family)
VWRWGRLKQGALALWDRARREHSTPREIGCSVGLGVFSGCTPFFGFHMWVAIGLASLFRLNRLWAFLGSRVSFTPLFAVIAFCEIECAHRLRTGAWAALSLQQASAQGWDWLTDWVLGTAIIGTALGLVIGVVAYLAARGFTRRTPDAARSPSSESPPTAPPAPTP